VRPRLTFLLAVTVPFLSPRETAAQAPANWMRPGVSLALAQHRSRTLSEVRYQLTLDVTALDSAIGRVVIRFRRSDTSAVILDFRGRRLRQIAANGATLPATGFTGSHILVPAAALTAGENTLELEFVSEIAPSGASVIRFHDRSDNSDYLYTLLVPADANQLFPCFDQPDLKAKVSLSLAAPPGWTAVANGPERSADTTAGAIVHRFAETRPISTYLIAFAAGPWARASSTVNGRTLHAYVRGSRAREADLDSVLALNHRALQWMEQYFARPLPFDKFDFVLAPAFPFGGMEHPGAVFYNEDRFIFRERPTLPRRLGRFSTILHETTHMWFGDLVTMQWFDDLWLKEGFATYIAAKALAELDTASGAWKNFYLGNKPAAYAVDQTAGTTPVWQMLANLDQAKSNYGAIVYNKAPSVLKQLDYLVGEQAFRAGVQSFLTQHAYANATWRDLLAAIGGEAHRPLDDWGRQFVLRPGMPQIEQRLIERDGKIQKLELAQRPAQALSGPGPWPMRTEVLFAWADGSSRTIPVELTDSVTEVPVARGLPAPVYLFANARDYGYMLTLLDSASVAGLERGALGKTRDSFLRAMLWGALWDQVRATRLAPARFARLALRELPAERDEQIAPSILGKLVRTIDAYLGAAERETVRREAERVLWSGAQDTTRPYGIRKSHLDAFVDIAGSGDGVVKLETLLDADSAAGEPMRDPTRWDVVTRLLILGAANAEPRFAQQRARDTTPDGLRRTFIAGAGRRAAATKRDYFTRYFADSALNEDWATGSLEAFTPIEQVDLTLPYLRPALDSLRFIQSHRRIFFLGSWLGAFLGGQTSPAALETVRAFLAAHPDLPIDLKQKVLQVGDELERTVRIRRRWGS
jgi:aminopeptidase N